MLKPLAWMRFGLGSVDRIGKPHKKSMPSLTNCVTTTRVNSMRAEAGVEVGVDLVAPAPSKVLRLQLHHPVVDTLH
jgi:hypothetical protein